MLRWVSVQVARLRLVVVGVRLCDGGELGKGYIGCVGY